MTRKYVYFLGLCLRNVVSLRWLTAVLTGTSIFPVVFIQSPEVPRLNSVVENGAVVLCSFGPQQLHPRVSNLLHANNARRPGDTWRSGNYVTI